MLHVTFAENLSTQPCIQIAHLVMSALRITSTGFFIFLLTSVKTCLEKENVLYKF